jgi:hypothetical protein
LQSTTQFNYLVKNHWHPIFHSPLTYEILYMYPQQLHSIKHTGVDRWMTHQMWIKARIMGPINFVKIWKEKCSPHPSPTFRALGQYYYPNFGYTIILLVCWQLSY